MAKETTAPFPFFFCKEFSCLRNAVSMFEIMEREMVYRKENGIQPGFESLVACKPMLAVGAATPLEGQDVVEDGFRKSFVCV